MSQMNQMGQMFQPGGAGYFVPQMPNGRGSFFAPQQMGSQMRASPRWTTVRQQAPAGGFQTMPSGPQMRPSRPTGQATMRAGMSARPITGQTGQPQQQPRHPGQQVPGRGIPAVAPAPVMPGAQPGRQPMKGSFTVSIICVFCVDKYLQSPILKSA